VTASRSVSRSVLGVECAFCISVYRLRGLFTGMVQVCVCVCVCVQWMQLRSRKQNLIRLFEQMQQYQFDTQLSADVDQPLESHVRALTDDDVDRSLSLSVCLSVSLSVCSSLHQSVYVYLLLSVSCNVVLPSVSRNIFYTLFSYCLCMFMHVLVCVIVCRVF